MKIVWINKKLLFKIMQPSTVDIHSEVFAPVGGFGKTAMFAGRRKGAAELLSVGSQKQRIAAWLRLEDITGVHLVQPLDQAGSLRTRLPKTKRTDGF